MTLREQLLNGCNPPKKTITVTLADGTAVPVEVRGLSVGARGRLFKEATTTDADGNGVVDQEKLIPRLVQESAFDPESGAKIFEATDLEALAELGAGALDPIVLAATGLTGIGELSAKVAEKN